MTASYLNPFCGRLVTCVGNYSYENGIAHCDRIFPDHILIYFLSGSWEIWQNDILYCPKEGQCIFLHAQNHHYGFKECEPGTNTLFFHFSADPSDCLLADEDTSLSQDKLCFPTVFSSSSPRIIQRRFDQISELFWTADTPKRTAQLSAYLQLLLSDLNTIDGEEGFSRLIIKTANQLMRENPKRNIQIEELASKLNMSTRTASRKFQLATQTSFLQYQITYRLNTALNLLKANPVLTNREIAISLNFYDEFHFGKLFKKHFGFTPNDVRRNKAIDSN